MPAKGRNSDIFGSEEHIVISENMCVWKGKQLTDLVNEVIIQSCIRDTLQMFVLIVK